MQTEPHLNFEDISLRTHDEDEFRYSNMSTPTLTSDASSLRSSLSSFSSPILAQGPFSARQADAPLVRKLSLPDNTSMASLSRIPVQRRNHKQRESDFNGDTDDFWPTDAVMFNVPMSPALCAQSKVKPKAPSLPLPAIKEQDMLDSETREIQLKYATHSASTSSLHRKSKSKSKASQANQAKSASQTSLTRPEHLPPKSAQEERRHMQQYNQLVAAAKAQEKVKSDKENERAERRQQQCDADARVWEKSLKKGTKVSRTLWWRGVPEKCRQQAWTQKLGIAASAASSAPNSSACLSPNPNPALASLAERVFPECGLFGAGRPFHESLQAIVSTVASRRSLSLECAAPLLYPAATLLLAMDEPVALECLLALVPSGGLVHAVLSGNEALSQAHYTSYYKVFRSKFPHLYTHFTTVRLAPQHYLDRLIASFMLEPLGIEAAGRLMDLVVSEGESFLLRTALGYVAVHEPALYQQREVAIDELVSPITVPQDQLIDTIKSISR